MPRRELSDPENKIIQPQNGDFTVLTKLFSSLLLLFHFFLFLFWGKVEISLHIFAAKRKEKNFFPFRENDSLPGEKNKFLFWSRKAFCAKSRNIY